MPARALWLVALALAPSFAAAQPVSGGQFGMVEDRQSNVPSYFFHVRPGEATKQVHVWGTVRAPGVYVVADEVGLGEVLTLAGGPLATPIPDRTERTVTVRVYHAAGGDRTVAYERPVAEMVREPQAWPALRSGDVVEVETRDVYRRDQLRDTAAIVGTVGSLAAVALQIVFLVTR